jgi:hypothetical protein
MLNIAFEITFNHLTWLNSQLLQLRQRARPYFKKAITLFGLQPVFPERLGQRVWASAGSLGVSEFCSTPMLKLPPFLPLASALKRLMVLCTRCSSCCVLGGRL